MRLRFPGHLNDVVLIVQASNSLMSWLTGTYLPILRGKVWYGLAFSPTRDRAGDDQNVLPLHCGDGMSRFFRKSQIVHLHCGPRTKFFLNQPLGPD